MVLKLKSNLCEKYFQPEQIIRLCSGVEKRNQYNKLSHLINLNQSSNFLYIIEYTKYTNINSWFGKMIYTNNV